MLVDSELRAPGPLSSYIAASTVSPAGTVPIPAPDVPRVALPAVPARVKADLLNITASSPAEVSRFLICVLSLKKFAFVGLSNY